MNAGGPLAGRTIVVTRPLAQAAPLAGAIAAAGGTPLVFPLLEISAALDPAPLAAALADIKRYALAVFISPNAVAYSVPALLALRPWPTGLQPAAVGQGTARALRHLHRGQPAGGHGGAHELGQRAPGSLGCGDGRRDG